MLIRDGNRGGRGRKSEGFHGFAVRPAFQLFTALARVLSYSDVWLLVTLPVPRETAARVSARSGTDIPSKHAGSGRVASGPDRLGSIGQN